MYRYHRGYGRDTDDCYDLKMEIDQLVKVRSLKKFTKDIARKQRGSDIQEYKQEDAKRTRREVSGAINMILGGEFSSKGRRKRMRKEVFVIVDLSIPNIIISQDDGSYMKQLYNDALVVSAYIKNYLVKRMVVDDRSDVNVLT